jgi:hypothetical protein
MTISLPETPMPDEIAVIFCLSGHGRIGARVGGLTHDEVPDVKERMKWRRIPGYAFVVCGIS